jgi:exosome complex RNA-binding protein Rrp42 (RNase PH superfamily)
MTKKSQFEFDGEKYKQDTVVERMIEKTKQPDGRCFETFRRIDVKAICQTVSICCLASVLL